MLNPNIQAEKNASLFSMQIPLKKSMIVDEFLDELLGARTTKRNNTRISTNSMKTSTLVGPQSVNVANFLARKIKRIVYYKIGQAFNKIVEVRKIVLNFDLLNAKPRKNMIFAFQKIKQYAQNFRQNKLEKLFGKFKQPIFIFNIIQRSTKRIKKDLFNQLQLFCLKKKNGQHFALKTAIVIHQGVTKHYKKIFFRKLNVVFYEKIQQKDSLIKISQLIPKIIQRNKVNTFRKLIQNGHNSKFESINSIKKETTTKLNESTVDKARLMASEKDILKQLKISIQSTCAEISKSKYQIRRDLNIYRSKIKDSQKKSKRIAGDLTKQNKKLQEQLQQLQKIFLKRLNRTQNKINKNIVEQQYASISKLQQNLSGEVKLKQSAHINQINSLDQFYVFQNQKLKQEIALYENSSVFDSMWPQEEAVFEQNKNLKFIIQELIHRSLHNYVHSQKINQQIQ